MKHKSIYMAAGVVVFITLLMAGVLYLVTLSPLSALLTLAGMLTLTVVLILLFARSVVIEEINKGND